MPLISLNGVSFDYGRTPILAEVDLALEPGQRAAVVGRNGAGKSTLFAVAAEEIRPDRGSVERARRLRIGHLRQDRALAGDQTLFGAVRGECIELVKLEAQLEKALAELGSLPPDGEAHDKAARRHGELQHSFEGMGGYDLDQRVAATLSGLGFAEADHDRPIAQLSGGEQRVAALAAVLLQNADLLLLDEPTNHLDLAAIEWLEDHLRQAKAAQLIVSHDRSFLDAVCELTYHIKDARLHRYSGNFSFYEKERAERERQANLAYDRQREEIARHEEYIRRNIVGQKTKQAQSRRKRLEKMVRLEKPSEERTLRVRLSPARRGGNTVLDAEKLAKAFGEKKLFAGVDLHLTRGEKIGVVGPNGAGKTTLLRILMGELPPDAGRVRLGKDVDLGFFDQHLDLVSDAHTVEEEFRTLDPSMSEGELRGQLARFGFFADDLDKKVGQLSGGERNRLSLLKLVYQRHNFLILDEPTNHLDIGATESLEEALEAYEGTLLFISHDRSFLERLAGRIIDVGGGGVTDFAGTWSEYRARTQRAVEAERKGSGRQAAGGGGGAGGAAAADGSGAGTGDPGSPPPAPPAGGGAAGKGARTGGPRLQLWSKNRLAQKRKTLAELEARIAEAQSEKEELEAKLAASAELDRDAILTATCRHAELQETIERREERWAGLAEEIEVQERARYLTERGDLGVHLALVAIVLVWGAAYPLVKLLLAVLDPTELALSRFWICLPALLAMAVAMRAEVLRLLRRHPLRLALLGLLGVPGYHMPLNVGTRLLSEDPATAASAAMLASILVASVPAWTALFARLAGQERLAGRQWLGQLTAFAGVVLLVSRGRLDALQVTPGALWVLGAPASWALYTVVARPLLSSLPSSLPLLIAAMLLGTAALSPFAPPGILASLGGLGAVDWARLGFVGLLSTLGGYVVWATAIRRMPATRVAVYVYFIPAVSLVSSWLLAGERLNALVLLGGAMILGGVTLTRAPRPRVPAA